MAEAAPASIDPEGQAILAGIQEHGLPYTTADGEEWREINIPDFRVVEGPKGYRFVSSRGRVLNQSTKINEARGAEESHKAIGLTMQVPGAFGTCVLTPIHTIAATAFLGPRPSSRHTVDHINRIPWDNRIENLRWALPEVQLTNRDRVTSTMSIDGSEGQFKTFSDVAKVVGINEWAARKILRHVEPGQSATLNGFTVRVLSRQVKRVRPCEAAASVGSQKKPKQDKVQYVAYRQFMEGQSIEQIARERGVKETTVLTYIRHVVCASEKPEIMRLAERLSLTDPVLRCLVKELVERTFADKAPDGSINKEPVRIFVQSRLSAVARDWEVVLGVALNICHALGVAN